MVRLKHRYIIAQVLPDTSSRFVQGKTSVTSRDIQSVVRDKIQELYGDVGLGEFGQASYIKYYDAKYSNIFVIKTTREAQVKVHFALSCIAEVSEVHLMIRSLSVNSCPRTCMESLKKLFESHFQAAEFTTELERMAATQVVDKNLSSLEL
jgi:RNase P/RNase MRP subunit POP5